MRRLPQSCGVSPVKFSHERRLIRYVDREQMGTGIFGAIRSLLRDAPVTVDHKIGPRRCS